jgi:hypothetical protein
MSNAPVTSVTDELVAEIQRDFDRNGPCPHFNWNPLGSGDWIHCDDCGQQVGIEHLESAKAASEKHGNLSVVLRSILAERAELLRDAERYAFVKTMPAEMLLAWRGMYGFADEAIDAAMQPEARP